LAGLTPAHLFLFLIIALVVIGPGKLPEVGSAVGKSIREFQKASSGVQESITGALAQPAPQASTQQVQPPMAPPQVWSQLVVYAEPGYEAGYMPPAYPAQVHQASAAPSRVQPIEAAPAAPIANEAQPEPRAD
jgi:TatA/E family protein of Tat protein translocase